VRDGRSKRSEPPSERALLVRGREREPKTPAAVVAKPANLQVYLDIYTSTVRAFLSYLTVHHAFVPLILDSVPARSIPFFTMQ
jgi:hypothetical protein